MLVNWHTNKLVPTEVIGCLFGYSSCNLLRNSLQSKGQIDINAAIIIQLLNEIKNIKIQLNNKKNCNNKNIITNDKLSKMMSLDYNLTLLLVFVLNTNFWHRQPKLDQASFPKILPETIKNQLKGTKYLYKTSLVINVWYFQVPTNGNHIQIQ